MDMSLGCQMRWEAKFPELAAKETFVDYSDRLKNIKSKNAAIILSKMKVIYCFFETELNFTSFVKMFDFTNLKFTETLLDRIDEIFNLVLSSASEKN